MIPDIDAFKRSLSEQRGKRCPMVRGKCPGDACPAWWRTQWTRVTAEGPTMEILEGCSFRLNQLYMQELLNSTAAARNTVHRNSSIQEAAALHVGEKLTQLASTITQAQLPAAEEESNDQPL